MAFDPELYTVEEDTEDGFVQLMITSNISSQCPFEVQLVTVDGTATGEQ